MLQGSEVISWSRTQSAIFVQLRLVIHLLSSGVTHRTIDHRGPTEQDTATGAIVSEDAPAFVVCEIDQTTPPDLLLYHLIPPIGPGCA